MVCLGNMCMDTVHKGDNDDDDDDNNNNNNNNNKGKDARTCVAEVTLAPRTLGSRNDVPS